MALSTWIADVTNSTLNMSSSVFSFQDALSLTPRTSDYNSITPYLFHSGCSQDDGTQNCTASCQNSSKVFASLDTLHNCMVYPTVADLYARDNLSNASLAGYYNIQKSRVKSDLYNNITNTITSCLVDYCTITLNGSGCKERLSGTSPESSPSNITSTLYVYRESYGYDGSAIDFCDYVPKSFNPDIGGIGVRSLSIGLHQMCLLTN